MGSGCKLHDELGALWFETPIPTLPYNSVLRFSADVDEEVLIDRIFATYRKRGVQFAWVVHPSAVPTNLVDLLNARGLQEAEVVHGMWLDLNHLPAQTPAIFLS